MKNLISIPLILLLVIISFSIKSKAKTELFPELPNNIISYNSSNPDSPFFDMSYVAGIPDVKWGTNIGLLSIENNKVNTYFTFYTLLDLYNETPGYFEAPNELWRGCVGLYLYNKINIIENKSELLSRISIVHESDHYTLFGSHTLINDFPYDGGVNLATPFPLDYIEYIGLSINYSHKLSDIANIVILGEGKYFIDLSVGSQVLYNSAYNLEFIYERIINNNLSLFGSVFYENTSRNSVITEVYGGSNYDWFTEKFGLDDANKYFFIRIGLNLKKQKMIQPYLIYTISNGRGLNFLSKYKGFGIGIRIIPFYKD